MKLINLTPHTINIISEGNTLTIQPEATPARVSSYTEVTGSIEVNGITVPLTSTKFGEIQNLPDATEGTMYIVSLAVANRCPERNDVFVPNGTVRNEQGQIIGCTSLAHI